MRGRLSAGQRRKKSLRGKLLKMLPRETPQLKGSSPKNVQNLGDYPPPPIRRGLKDLLGLSWWSNGQDSTLPMQGARVQSLVGELRSCRPCGQKKKNPLISQVGKQRPEEKGPLPSVMSWGLRLEAGLLLSPTRPGGLFLEKEPPVRVRALTHSVPGAAPHAYVCPTWVPIFQVRKLRPGRCNSLPQGRLT